MRQAVALFEEKDTRDELGIGSIRDAFADELFPGTSVIQTRLRYTLLVPWLYARLESDRRVNSANVEQCMRADELKLITVLLATHDTLGGHREALRRYPAAGAEQHLLAGAAALGSVPASLDHRRVPTALGSPAQRAPCPDASRRSRGRARPGLDLASRASPPPSDLFSGAGFALRWQESEFIRDRIAVSCAGSLLAHCATTARRLGLVADEPWLELVELPHALGRTLTLARRFALLV